MDAGERFSEGLANCFERHFFGVQVVVPGFGGATRRETELEHLDFVAFAAREREEFDLTEPFVRVFFNNAITDVDEWERRERRHDMSLLSLEKERGEVVIGGWIKR